ncbi:MFS transporter [Specibacter cremeus]|uniref:MFS transporter n=1 Tax=Specibacter cremeus TaxID=1629051 RepID=UPI0013DD8C8F|nr:MFS transporter [Specibacter cremeus]
MLEEISDNDVTPHMHQHATAAQLYARLDRLPMTWAQGRILLQGGISTTLDGLDNGIVSFILPVVATAFAMTGTQQGLFGSAALVGALLGDLALGVLGNRMGRRNLLIWSLVVYSGAILVGALAPSWQFLLATRFLAGIGIGISVNVVVPYLAEFAPPAKRSHYVGSLAGFFGLGFVLAAILGLIIPTFDGAWRFVQVLVGLPVLLAFWWRRALPESPRYLLMHGRVDEAEAVVEGLERRVVARTKAPLPPVPEASQTVAAARPFREKLGAQLVLIWGRALRRRTFVLWVITITLSFAYYGFLTFLPTLLMQRGMSITESFSYSLLVEIAQVVGYYPAAVLAEKLDRKWSLAIFMVLSVASAGWLAVAPSSGQVLIASILLGFFLNGAYAPLYAYSAEIYPTESRAAGTAMSDAASRIGAALSPAIIGATYASIKFGGVFAMISVVLFLGVIVIVTMGMSTKGRSLEELGALDA